MSVEPDPSVLASPQRQKSRLEWHLSKWIFPTLAVLLAFVVFYHSADTAGISQESFLFWSPCCIFAITTFVYYGYVTEQTGSIAGLSIVGLLAALYGCMKILGSDALNWEAHLKWMYFLFWTYVTWDCIMLAWLLPGNREIAVLSTHINQPTLFTILLMWIASHLMVHTDDDVVSVRNWVDGVVAFHLAFATSACVRTIFYWRFEAT